MDAEHHKPGPAPCLCNALRQASRAVSRLYDEELRGVGLRTTQYSLLQFFAGPAKFGSGTWPSLTLHDETTLTRNLRPLVAAGWVAVRSGKDRREKWLPDHRRPGLAKLEEARPAWERRRRGCRRCCRRETWQGLLAILPEVARLTAGA